MSIDSILSTISRLQKDVADIQKKISEEDRAEAQKLSRINQTEKSITKNTSASTYSSKMNEVSRLRNDIARISSRRADLSKKLASKTSDLIKSQQQLSREQEQERKKIEEAQKRRDREQLEYQKKLTGELETQRTLLQEVKLQSSMAPLPNSVEDNMDKFDLFISHASEDKEEFVRPLAQALEKNGVRVWYDEFTLKIGDSLRRSIDKGLARSRFGLVIVSSSFIKKNWTQYELDGMVAREMEGVKVILPVWHKVTKSEVMDYSPSLADKYALNSSMMSIEEIANELIEVLK